MKGSRHKLYSLARIFVEYTDEQHPISMQEIISHLNQKGISAERKSVYSDINFLKEMGYEIEGTRGRGARYYLSYRLFDLAELKLLVDAVHSSRFITQNQSDRLINKLTSLTSIHQAQDLSRQIYTTEIPKSLNTNVLYSVDVLHQAINKKKQISFKYFQLTPDKSKKLKREGKSYIYSPIALCWNSDKYYVVCYNQKYDQLTNFRVDRMEKVEMVQEDWDDQAYHQDINKHLKSLFGMYDGEVVEAELEFSSDLVNVVIDKFGGNIPFEAKEDTFVIKVPITDTQTFHAWLFQLGNKAKILSPDSLRLSLKNNLANLLEHHD